MYGRQYGNEGVIEPCSNEKMTSRVHSPGRIFNEVEEPAKKSDVVFPIKVVSSL